MLKKFGSPVFQNFLITKEIFLQTWENANITRYINCSVNRRCPGQVLLSTLLDSADLEYYLYNIYNVYDGQDLAAAVPGHSREPGELGGEALCGAVEEAVPPGHQPLQGAQHGRHGETDSSPG